MTTTAILDATGTSRNIQNPLAPGRAAAASSKPVVLSTEDAAVFGATTDAKDSHTDATALSMMQVLKQMSYALQAIMADPTVFGSAVVTITSSTTVTDLLAVDATHYKHITGIWFDNKSATGTEVILYDTDGTTERARFYVPATETRGATGIFLRGSAINSKWKWKTVTSVDSVYATVNFMISDT